MAMKITYNTATSLGRVRLAIGDTDQTEGAGVKPDGTNFEDEEINVFLALYDDWREAVVMALRVLANMYTSHARQVWVEAYKEDLTKIAGEYQTAADKWEAKIAATAGSSDAFAYNEDAPMYYGDEQWGAEVTDQRA